MTGKRWLVLTVLLGGLLTVGPSWGQDSSYNAKMAKLPLPYFKIQEALADDSLEGVPENARRLVKLTQEIRLLVADKLPAGGKRKLEQMKRSAGRLGGKDILVVRQHFQVLSRVVIEYLDLVGLPDSLRGVPLYVFYCPMTDARWLQDNFNLRNPFYGKLMLKTGRLEGKLQSKITAAYNGF